MCCLKPWWGGGAYSFSPMSEILAWFLALLYETDMTVTSCHVHFRVENLLSLHAEYSFGFAWPEAERPVSPQWMFFRGCLPNWSLKRNWMQLYEADVKNEKEQILWMKRRRKLSTESERDRHQQDGWAPRCPRPFCLSLLLSSSAGLIVTIYKISLSPSSLFSFLLFLPDIFAQKALYVAFSLFIVSSTRRQSMSSSHQLHSSFLLENPQESPK